MYAIIKDNAVIKTGELEQMFISNVFPPSGTPEWLEEHDVYEVIVPAYDSQAETLQGIPPQITGRTVVLHQVVPLPEPVQIIEPVQISEPVAQTQDTIAADSIGADSI